MQFVAVAIALCWLLSERLALAVAMDAAPVQAQIAEDGRSFRVTATGLTNFQAGWSATIERGGQQQVLSSSEGQVSPGTVKTIQFSQAGIELLFRLEPAPGLVGVLAQAGIRNTGREPVNLVSVTPVAAEFGVLGHPAEWLVTGLCPQTPVLTTVGDLKGSLDVHEYGGLYRNDRTGFLFGPVGDPVAYMNARFTPASAGQVALSLTADMSRGRVDPGETRWGQQVVLLMEKPQSALAHWAGWVGASHRARTDKGALAGWNNWNFLQNKKTDQELMDVTDAVLGSGGRLQPGVMQIEEGEPNADALAAQRQRVTATRARFGTRLIFIQTVDLGAPRVKPEITETVKRAVQNGFTYLKIIY